MKRALTAVAVMVAAGTAVGLAILWPGETHLRNSLAVDAQKAEVVEVVETSCPGLGNQRCQLVTPGSRAARTPGSGSSCS